jgi:hypothetical protein
MATRTIANGGGNWGTVGTWVEGAVPLASDDVVATATSGAVTIDAGAVCRSINLASYVSTITHSAAVTLTIGDATAGASNVALSFPSSGWTYTLSNATTSAISFISTSATVQTVNFGAETAGNVTFNGAAGSWQLTGTFNAGTTASLTLTTGTLDFNGQTITVGSFASTSGLTRVIKLGTGTTININGTGGWNGAGNTTGLSYVSGTETINVTSNGSFSGYNGGTNTYNIVNITVSTASAFVQGNIGTLAITGSAQLNNKISIDGGTTIRTSLTVTGNSQVNRIAFVSSSGGSPNSPTINAASVTLSNVDFYNLTFQGTATPLTGTSLANVGGTSTGVTFTSPVTRYWVGNAGNWSDTTHWSTTTGGSSGATMPTPNDAVIFDSNSFSSGSQTITGDVAFVGASLNFTGVTNSPTFHPNTNQGGTTWYSGSVTCIAGMALNHGNSNVNFVSSGTTNVTSAGQLFSNNALFQMTAAGILNFIDAFSTGNNGTQTFDSGTINTNNNSVTFANFSTQNATSKTFNAGTSTITLTTTNSGTGWSASNMTVSGSNAMWVFSNTSTNSRTFAGNGQTYGTLTYTVAGSTGALVITGANTFGTINFSDASNVRTITFPASTTNTVTNNFNVNGTASFAVTINSSSSGTQATLSSPGGANFICNYVSIKDSNAVGNVWYAITGATNVSNNTGWDFNSLPFGIVVAPSNPAYTIQGVKIV